MAMPTKAKTWAFDPNHRITYTTLLDVQREQLYRCKEFIKGVSGATVRGSSDNVTAAMDGTDRVTAAGLWASNNATASTHSWIVVRFANMGNVDLLLEYVGAGDEYARIAYSPGGYAINATNPRYSPTAADEVIIVGTTTGGGLWGNSNLSGDRIWTSAKASDGKAIMFLVARAGVWVTYLILQEVTSAVLSPATFSPAVAGVGGAAAPAITTWTNSTNWKSRANGVNLGGAVGCYVSMEGAANTTIPQLYSSTLTLQGSQWPIMALGLWSQTAGATGKLGNLVDVWAGNVNANDGDTYPNDASREFVALGDYVVTWASGIAPVMS